MKQYFQQANGSRTGVNHMVECVTKCTPGTTYEVGECYIEPTENFYTEWKPKVFYSKRYFKWTYEQWKAKYCKEDYP